MEIINDEDLYLLEDGSYEWNDKPFTGMARKYFDSGEVASEIQYADGLQDGEAKFYIGGGVLSSIEHWKKNTDMARPSLGFRAVTSAAMRILNMEF